GVANIYKGKISLRNKDYKGAADFFEEAYKEDPTNTVAKDSYDKALAYFYGDGIFAFNLLDTDYSNSSAFRKQYMITRKISKSYATEIISTKLSPRNDGSHFDIQMDLRLTLAPDVYSMTSELIKKFSTGGPSGLLDDGVYNPNATKVLDERELFENNVGNFLIVVKLLDKDGNTLQQSSQSFKSSFNLTFSGAVKNVFKNIFSETSFSFPSVGREIVKNTTKVLITIE
ncbi:MAG: tetratricopeptide repeat protein, partial [Candidatus Delongbacteria bacterium]|nr:tetratricopeptide repeat protein [Candidatus Delongbacteria bacterium]MCG2760295.1 tetratricopeptide repeat protein [Candidatus Delongbacteria bacterium]